MARDSYAAQVGLLVNALPFVAREADFALKGGTAINLFYRDMPRLSVDIDLVYLPLNERAKALAKIDAAFDRLARQIERGLKGVGVRRIAGGGGGDTRLMLRVPGAEVKIEVSPVTRGTIHPPVVMTVTEPVEEAFGFAETQVVAFEDLYAGKMCAALDRQHPRDLYDMKLLYENEGVTDELFRTFLVYAACSGRPLHELIAPHLHMIDQAFAKEFEGMTVESVPLDDLLATRIRLVEDVAARIDEKAAAFLLSLHDGEPDFAAIDRDTAAKLPAIQWKLLNLHRLAEVDPAKHEAQRQALARAIGA